MRHRTFQQAACAGVVIPAVAFMVMWVADVRHPLFVAASHFHVGLLCGACLGVAVVDGMGDYGCLSLGMLLLTVELICRFT